MPVVSTGELPAGKRRYLYLTAAITGAAIMIVEILGAKMLAPYVGTSHFVWTAQIAVTLVALAAGYYGGGWLVDRAPKLERMYWGILAAAIYLCAAMLVVEKVAYACLRFSLATGTLLASLFLFFVPLSLLAMVGPFFVRMLTSSVSGVGSNVGRLTAISTLGSFIGTVLIGYTLIPLFPNSVTMLGTAVVLMITVLLYFVVWARRNVVPVAIGAAVAVACGMGAVAKERQTRFQQMDELTRRNSPFGLLQVLHEKGGNRRFYLNDYLTQNTYDVTDKKSTSMFTYMLHKLARAYAPEVKDVLCIGLGIGIVPMQFAREGAAVDVIEINPDIVPIAEKYFDLEPAKLNVQIGDGRYYVSRSKKQYDAIILDAFLGDSSPSHLMTREAFAEMRRALKPNGVLVINSFGDFSRGQDFFTASLDKTLRTVFASVRIHNDGRDGNTLFVASPRATLEILHPPSFEDVHVNARSYVMAAFDGLRETSPDSGRVLTDDYNPVEFYDAKNRERLRKDLAMRIREL